ncbi:MAG: head-tail connector protein [Pseudomonadota bacterium]
MAYTTSALVKTYLGISGSGDDTLLGTLVTRAQAAIDRYCGRTFEASTNTDRYFDPVRDSDGRTLRLDRDLCSINSITNGDSATVTATQYVTEPRNDTPYYAIRLLASSGTWWTYVDDPENAITISGKWAYSTTAPDDIVQAATRLAAWSYKMKDSQVFDQTATTELGVLTLRQRMPTDVADLLAPYRKVR